MKDYANYQSKKLNRITLFQLVLVIGLFLIIALASNNDYSQLYKNSHSTAWVNCTAYYTIPCDENGELKIDLSDQKINSLYEADARGEIQLSDFEIRYLQAIDKNN